MNPENLNFHPENYDHTCYIVGGGPSLIDFDWNLLGPDKFVIAINRAYEVLPNAQVVYFTDDDWYAAHEQALLKHKGCLIKGSLPADLNVKKFLKKFKSATDVVQFRLLAEKGWQTQPGCLSHGRNSTYAAINMAGEHFGFKKIYLLGIDMKWQKPEDVKKATKHNSTTHWHDGHRRIDPESIYKTMMANYNTMVQPAKQRNIEIINVNSLKMTDLRVFPIKSFEEVFGS